MKLPAAAASKNTAAGAFVRSFALLVVLRWWSCGSDGVRRWWVADRASERADLFLAGHMKSSSGSGWIFHGGTHIMAPRLLQVQDLAATTSHLAIWAESSAIFHIASHRWIFIRLMYGTPRDTYATIEHPAPAVPMNL
jgi:hypothetical protein